MLALVMVTIIIVLILYMVGKFSQDYIFNVGVLPGFALAVIILAPLVGQIKAYALDRMKYYEEEDAYLDELYALKEVLPVMDEARIIELVSKQPKLSLEKRMLDDGAATPENKVLDGINYFMLMIMACREKCARAMFNAFPVGSPGRKELLESTNEEGLTTLGLAAKYGHIQMCQLLIEFGFDFRTCKVSPLIQCVASAPLNVKMDERGIECVHFLCKLGSILENDGYASLALAAQSKRTGICRVLGSACTTLPRLKSCDTYTPYLLSIVDNQHDSIKMILLKTFVFDVAAFFSLQTFVQDCAESRLVAKKLFKAKHLVEYLRKVKAYSSQAKKTNELVELYLLAMRRWRRDQRARHPHALRRIRSSRNSVIRKW